MALRPPKDDLDQQVLDFIPERFDADADSRQARRGAHGRLLLSIALGLAAIVATVVTIWYVFANQRDAATTGGVPLVAAEQGPIKTKPVEPGGMEVPNQDKLVYDRLGRDAPAQAERLLPPPEQPKAPPAVAARPPMPSLATPKPSMEALTAAEPAPPAEIAKAEPPAPVAPEPPATVASEQVAPPAPPQPAEPKQQAAAAPPAQPASAPPPAAAATPVAAAPAVKVVKNGAWLIQVAAMRDQAAAEKEWGRIQGANRDLLGGLASDIVRADLGARGVFWRVRGGPLDEAAARRVCDELGKRKIGCMLVRK